MLETSTMKPLVTKGEIKQGQRAAESKIELVLFSSLHGRKVILQRQVKCVHIHNRMNEQEQYGLWTMN